MKTLFICIIAAFALTMASCSPTDSQKSEVVAQYLAETTIFECKIISLREPTWEDSSKFLTNYYYVLGRDVYDAQRNFEQALTEIQEGLNGTEVYWKPLSISQRQKYPYIY